MVILDIHGVHLLTCIYTFLICVSVITIEVENQIVLETEKGIDLGQSHVIGTVVIEIEMIKNIKGLFIVFFFKM